MMCAQVNFATVIGSPTSRGGGPPSRRANNSDDAFMLLQELQVGSGRLRAIDLDYPLPPELIAQHPLPVRDAARLMVVDREAGTVRDSAFVDLPEFLSPTDLLILNDTKVLPAKLATRRATGGKIAGLFVRELGDGNWEVMLRGTSRLKPGEKLNLEPADHGDALHLLEHHGGGRWSVRLESDADTPTVLARVGATPLPPYIKRNADSDLPEESGDLADQRRYQTIFAVQPGAIAAPTASLHFTDRVFASLDDRGIERAMVTLHVGPGTFTPIATDIPDEHRMEYERYDLPASTAERIAECRRRSGSIVAAGTTTVRVLESCAKGGIVMPGSGETDIFIKPPYRFRAVDRLLTNFHLPRSTLLALVMAFAGVELTRSAYAHAIEHRYRFYSYGDAMLIL